MKNSLYNAISNISQNFYDHLIEANVQKKVRSGMRVVIIRREVGHCCDWCRQRAGVYDYSDAPADVFHRHDNCRCMVVCRTEKGVYQDAWSKIEYQSQREARIARSREIDEGNQLDELNLIKRKAKSKGAPFADTTEYWLSVEHGPGTVVEAESVTVDGKKYKIDGKNVVFDPKPGERATADLLAKLFGGTVELLPRVNWPHGIKTADYAVNGVRIDRKSPTGSGKYTIQNNVREAKGQANNVILDLSLCPLDVNQAIKHCESVYTYKNLAFLDMLIVTKDGELLKVFEKI